ncbi:MAG: TspO/MBR family protein [Pseudomonadota bacterium]|jgi:benzodiazapine receptor|uniref:TspO/MBR family protein n=1 Tax=Sphingobium sp. CECT 9361 TaxID=2845384 RepID=UPI001E3533B3|nr:TspO/MBR family protein [Sphingobium sp. CECT 9361]CAH0353802.1 Tryptophan-rich protein TspO [Sphingobium sp. CECT 9361]
MIRAWLFPILIAACIAIAVAALGATITDIGPWYRSLVMPRWAPPDAAYGIGWTIIYSLTALAAVTGWHATRTRDEADKLIGLFALNGFLNILWSLLFFRLHRPDWALFEVMLLWLSVGSLILFTWPRSMAAALLLVPYICWVTFAGYLNMTIVRLNGPFG